MLRLPWLNSATRAARRACSKTPCPNLPTLRPPSREPLWIRGSRFSNQQRRFSKSRLPWTAAAVDPRLERGDCFATVHCFFLRLVPAFSWLSQAREVACLASAPKPNVGAPRYRWKRGGILGHLSRPLALQPALPAGHTARTRGIPRRVAVLSSRHKARDVGKAQTTVTRLRGVRQARQVTGAAALTSNGARIVSLTVSHRISNRTVSISTIRPKIWRAVRPSAKLRCLQANNRPGGFDTSRYCSDIHQFPVYTDTTNNPFV